ncbi:MAG: biotin/lipoyl-binding protein [Anaerolineales bacterium]|nr:biotin/lipoyl-binding protein [Anaerolineales bacterium]MCX7607961.1 biotin/lipoyl-binding protein [Anaerolineales bacterium]MDW8228034.1 biotin/lipoyl-containing protein [Anaerolineales bacterium]
MKYIAEIDGLEFPIEILDEQHIRFGEEVIETDLSAVNGQPLYSLLINGESYEAYVYPDEEGLLVLLLGQFFSVKVTEEREKRLRASQLTSAGSGEWILRAPMPGLIVSVLVKEGQTVEKGQILVILESMKMQNELRAPREGRVTRLQVRSGESVEQRQILLQLI